MLKKSLCAFLLFLVPAYSHDHIHWSVEENTIPALKSTMEFVACHFDHIAPQVIGEEKGKSQGQGFGNFAPSTKDIVFKLPAPFLLTFEGYNYVIDCLTCGTFEEYPNYFGTDDDEEKRMWKVFPHDKAKLKENLNHFIRIINDFHADPELPTAFVMKSKGMLTVKSLSTKGNSSSSLFITAPEAYDELYRDHIDIQACSAPKLAQESHQMTNTSFHLMLIGTRFRSANNSTPSSQGAFINPIF
jgi:hypothetical protein